MNGSGLASTPASGSWRGAWPSEKRRKDLGSASGRTPPRRYSRNRFCHCANIKPGSSTRFTKGQAKRVRFPVAEIVSEHSRIVVPPVRVWVMNRSSID